MSNSSPKRIGGEYGAVRAKINIDKLNAYLVAHVPAISSPVDVQQFKSDDPKDRMRFVLRKKPAGQLLSSTAHQIEREYRVLSALHKHNTKPSTKPWQVVPVPIPYTLCEDVKVIGTSFYIMEYLDGRIFTDTRMFEVSPNDRREWRARAVDVDTGKSTGKIPFFDELVDWYQKHLPDERKTGLRVVHGDYKLDNLIFHPSENKVIGILDWELCTLGSPVGHPALSIWLEHKLGSSWQTLAISRSHGRLIPKNLPDDPLFKNFNLIKAFKNTTKDVPIPLEDLEREYCRLTNQAYPIEEMIFVRSWMLFRLAIISQGIAARFARHQASSEHAHIHTRLFPAVGELAKAVLEDEGYIVGNRYRL
ncbi:kinase-like domain-containing protein [Lanmaoa asiatica]|nr:kinase-like domain-containing protein [Lanmaoa asiatica]